MSDLIDDMVSEDETTRSMAGSVYKGLKSFVAKVSSWIGYSDIRPVETTPSQSSENTAIGSSGDSTNIKSSSVHRGSHIEHPYCFSEPRNPFVEDIGKDWTFPSDRTSKHLLEQNFN
jgi:hypothetical protein